MAFKIIKSETIEKNKWITVRKDTCETEKGIIDDYYVIEAPDVVSMVAITEDNQVLLVKEYKHGVQDQIVQIPSGYIDQNEQPLEAAKRELLEETGYATEEWVPLGKFAASPGRLSHYFHFYLAKKVKKIQEPKLDELENLTTIQIPLEELQEYLKKHNSDMSSSLGLALAQKELKD